MRTLLTTFGNRLTHAGAWISVLGTFLLIGGLIWDVTIHEGDPSLASHESVFTVDNPAHVVFLTGIALIVAGMFLFVLDRLREQRATSHGRPMAVAAVAVALTLLASGGVAAAVQTQFAAAANGGPTGHDHGATTPGGSPAPGHHATFVTAGAGCAPVGTPPSADQTAAASALVAAVKADWSPSLTIAEAATLGYLPPKTPAASKVLTHLANRASRHPHRTSSIRPSPRPSSTPTCPMVTRSSRVSSSRHRSARGHARAARALFGTTTTPGQSAR